MAMPQARPRSKYHRTKSQEQIEVTVRSGTKYMVLKDLLCAYSDIFRSGLAHTNKLYLLDVSDTTFELFQFWLHGQATRTELAFGKTEKKHGGALVKITGIFGDSAVHLVEEELGRSQLQLYSEPRPKECPKLAPAWLRELSKVSQNMI
jgi:hypothetical protein